MYKIKQLSEDFIVKEISKINVHDSGAYAYYLLKKIEYSTLDALQILSKKFRIPLKNFGFAGNKDKNAATEQKISIFMGRKNFESIKLNNIGLEYLGNGKGPISLGDLEGNEFTITIRNLDENEIKKIELFKAKKIRIANFFGSQRFSKNNHIVGNAITKKDFRRAAELILENKGFVEDEIKDYLTKNKNNYAGAIRLIPLKTRKLFVHSYQSFLFNKIVKQYLKDYAGGIKNIKVPIIGFNFELSSVKNKKLKGIVKRFLEDEKISPREFIIHQMPELTSEGGFRDLFFQVEGFKILEIGSDDLNENRQKIRLSFILPKSCYATVVVEHLLLL